ncbi:MAG: GxxExxY protein [Gemmatimonadaceae bacterium]
MKKEQMNPNDISGAVVDSAMKAHSALGPGLLESAYEACLAYELRKRGLNVFAHQRLPLIYDGIQIELGYTLDLLVEGTIVVELKATAALLPIHEAQLLSYLRLSGRRIGLLINFHALRLKDGIKRMVSDPRSPPQ